jgi:hypothetical protein
MAQYRAIVGLDYPPNKRAEAGDLVSDLPEKSVAWLLDSGFIEELDGKKTSKKTSTIIEETPVAQIEDESSVPTEETPAASPEETIEE